MPRNDVTCVICGIPIYGADSAAPEWTTEYRALYTEDLEIAKARLSGMGEREDFHDYLPCSRETDLENAKDNLSPLIDVSLLQNFFDLDGSLQLVDRALRYWGFPIHESCWNLLNAFFRQTDTACQQLFSLMLAFPVHFDSLDWGHDYGGTRFLEPNPSHSFPGELAKLSEINWDLIRWNDLGEPNVFCDPFDVEELRQLCDECSEPAEHNTEAQSPFRRPRGPSDVFGLLPAEILTIVLEALPSRDILHLKLASPTMAIFRLPDVFWASRFASGQEYDFVVEARPFFGRPFQWKKFYVGVKQISVCPSFKNRKRVSKLIAKLHRVVSDHLLSDCLGEVVESELELAGRKAPKEPWAVVSRFLHLPCETFTEGCRALRYRLIDITNKLSSVAISFVNVFDVEYVAGLRFIFADGSCESIGYRQQKEELLKLKGSVVDVPGISITGFEIAMDGRGARGLSILTEYGQSEWAGEHENVPIRKLQVREGSNLVLYAGFDTLKVVSLASPEPDSMENVDTVQLTLDAFWIPKLPPSQLSLHDLSKDDIWVATSNLPYTLLCFGGDHGEYLKNLVEVAVWIVGEGHVYGIDFRYDSEVFDGRSCHTLGRRGPFSNPDMRPHECPDETEDQRMVFTIDGLGGERIQQLELQTAFDGKLWAFRFRTNRGRQFAAPPAAGLEEDELPWVPVLETPAEIVGLYAILEHRVAFSTLGVLTMTSHDDAS